MKIPIVEIFETVQGEGPGLGKPSLFIRSGGCNLRCQFKGKACDTPYAVFTPAQLDTKAPELKFGYDKWYPTEIKDLVHTIKAHKLRHLVWSGGEPCMFQEAIAEVMGILNTPWDPELLYTAEVETNGTIPIIKDLYWNSYVLFNVSVKLKSSNQEFGYDDKRINPEALISLPPGGDRANYKFVITDPENDLKEIQEILAIRKLPVYIMPEGQTRVDQIKNGPTVVKLAIDNGFRYSPREHILLYDTKKGV